MGRKFRRTAVHNKSSHHRESPQRNVEMSLSTLPLSYCTNVHAGRSVEEVQQGLADYTAIVREKIGHPLAAGLWLAAPVVEELLSQQQSLVGFAERLANLGLTCHTLNAFPFGDFHSERVKENVYIPDWSQPQRLEYTEQCADVLARLMPEGTEGSISTVPLGFKPFDHADDFLDGCVSQLLELARHLDELHDHTGKLIRLAIEPEPFCLIETTDEAISFFDRVRDTADAKHVSEIAQRHLGLCYDVCHQAVEFEDVAESIRALHKAKVRINKVHITCALQLDHPAENPEAREALARYVEPRYLHQTFARDAAGQIHKVVDLTEQLAGEPSAEFIDAEQWRIHFHVPVDAEQLGPLNTTRPELKHALAAVANMEYAPHLEVETYTWEVLPGKHSADLVDGLTRELTATQKLLADLRGQSST